jgi:hypothetical protein
VATLADAQHEPLFAAPSAAAVADAVTVFAALQAVVAAAPFTAVVVAEVAGLAAAEQAAIFSLLQQAFSVAAAWAAAFAAPQA